MSDWCTIPLEEVASLDIQKVVVSPTESYRIAGVKIAGEGLFDRGTLSGGDTSYSKLHRLAKGQVVYRKLTAWEGPITVVPSEFDGRFTSSEFPTITLDATRLLPEFMELMCRDIRFHAEMKALCTGTAERRGRLSPEDLLTILVDLPPLTYQRAASAAVKRLDDLVRTAESLEAHAQGLYRAALDEIVDALATAAAPLSGFVDRLASGRSPRCEDGPPGDGEWGVLKVSSVRQLAFNGLEAKRLPAAAKPLLNAEVKHGDLLTIRASGSRRLVGAFCIAENPPPQRLMSDYHWRIETNDDIVDKRYLAHVMGSTPVREEIDLAVVGSTTAAKLSKARLLEVSVPLPRTLADQQAAAARLDGIHRVVGASHDQAEAARSVRRAALRSILTADTPVILP